MHGSLISLEEYRRRVIPELLKRWEVGCYCSNQQFLKLISFNFENYRVNAEKRIAPVALLDVEILLKSLIFDKFESIRPWQNSEGGADRTDRCPQCAQEFSSRYDQFSINMDRTTAHPLNRLQAASKGIYVVGFQYFTKAAEELDEITDFSLASSVDEFIFRITSRENNAQVKH